MKDFRDSIPIISQLKNEALRQRHWEYLMICTRKEFDSQEVFLLKEIFDMELYQFEVRFKTGQVSLSTLMVIFITSLGHC